MLVSPIKLENLVVLVYSTEKVNDNIVDVSTQVIDLIDAMEYKNGSIKIDLDKTVWSYNYWKDIAIGNNRDLCNNEGIKILIGTIGVYDKSNDLHLKSIDEAAKYFLIKGSIADD